MAWLTRVGDRWCSTDDLTLDDLEGLELVTGTGWAFINPLRSIKTARSLLALWLVKDGATDEVAQKTVGELTNRTLKHTFQYIDNDDLPDAWEDGLPVVDPKDQEASSTAT